MRTIKLSITVTFEVQEQYIMFIDTSRYKNNFSSHDTEFKIINTNNRKLHNFVDILNSDYLRLF